MCKSTLLFLKSLEKFSQYRNLAIVETRHIDDLYIETKGNEKIRGKVHF